MSTHGSAFPKSLLGQMLRRNGVALPQRYLRVLETLYQRERDDNDDKGQQRRQELERDSRAKDEGFGGRDDLAEVLIGKVRMRGPCGAVAPAARRARVPRGRFMGFGPGARAGG